MEKKRKLKKGEKILFIPGRNCPPYSLPKQQCTRCTRSSLVEFDVIYALVMFWKDKGNEDMERGKDMNRENAKKNNHFCRRYLSILTKIHFVAV